MYMYVLQSSLRTMYMYVAAEFINITDGNFCHQGWDTENAHKI
jgi:hypothetical protein